MIKLLVVYASKRFSDLNCNVIREIGDKFEVDQKRRNELFKAGVIEGRVDVVPEETKENSKGNTKKLKDKVEDPSKDTDESVNNANDSNEEDLVPNTSDETEVKTKDTEK